MSFSFIVIRYDWDLGLLLGHLLSVLIFGSKWVPHYQRFNFILVFTFLWKDLRPLEVYFES